MLCQEHLRWCGTPKDILKDARILKYDYNYGFENVHVKIPQKRHKVKPVQDANLRLTD